jgi:hypothetical protein
VHRQLDGKNLLAIDVFGPFQDGLQAGRNRLQVFLLGRDLQQDNFGFAGKALNFLKRPCRIYHRCS